MRILTFDIEDWFHLLDFKETQSVKSWKDFESRIYIGMQSIFSLLDKHNISATFFVLGWVAKEYPDIVREIDKRGFEIGSHSHLHQLAFNQSFNTFYNDVEESIKTIEDCIGKKVVSFRAPGFSITEENKWAFDALYKLGIKKDSSIFPAKRSHGGYNSYVKAEPSVLKYNGTILKEFPINTYNFLGKSLVFSGGGYFRVLPYSVIKKFTKNSDYVMSYFHPRDFDYMQPMLKGLPISRRFKSYVGLKKSYHKLDKWLQEFNFISLEQADNQIKWHDKKIIEI